MTPKEWDELQANIAAINEAQRWIDAERKRLGIKPGAPMLGLGGDR